MNNLRLIALISIFLVGCSAVIPSNETQIPQETPSLTETIEVTDALPLMPEATITPNDGVTLDLWIPPQFDLVEGTQAGDLFKARLDEFSQLHPGVRVEVRVKAEEGMGGLLDSITTTTNAAPSALPDLIALPHNSFEQAVLKELLNPHDSFALAMEDPDWYDYARQLAVIQDRVFGLPFAGDALALVYRPDFVETPPIDWTEALTSTESIVFPAADQSALFTLAQYQAHGGVIRDEQELPFLDSDILFDVLTFYRGAQQAGTMPVWIAQLENDKQVWDAFLEKQTNMISIWSSYHLSSLMADTTASQIPTSDGVPFTFAYGWVWAIPASDSSHQEMSSELALFLSEPEFQARWIEALGYLPTRPSSLAYWSNTSLQGLIDRIVLSAHLFPGIEDLSNLGPVLQQATIDVLTQENDPRNAADEAADALTGP